jgi:glycosyltransferase involved in cell wall biosynthesis
LATELAKPVFRPLPLTGLPAQWSGGVPSVPRRILLLITDLEIGGTPTVVRELAARLNAPPQVVVEVACLSTWGPVADQLKARGVTVHALDARGPRDLLRTARGLVRLVRSRGFDTVFSFLIHANTVAATAARFCRGVRFIQSIQTTQLEPRWHWRLQSAVHHSAERVVGPSAAVRDISRIYAGVPREKFDVIPNAIEPADFPMSDVSRQDPRPYPIGFLGRLDPVKRVPHLVRAVGLLGGLVRLHVFGEGEDRPRIESVIRELDLGSRVTLHGAVPRPDKALAKIGLLVLPSQAEGFGLVLIEAMAAGVPVVAANAQGVCDVVCNGFNGLLTRPESDVPLHEELAALIRQVVEDPTMRGKMIANGREWVGRFTWPQVLPKYRKLLRLG